MTLIALTHRDVLPGFRLTLGFTLFYLSLPVLIPLAVLVFKAAGLNPQGRLMRWTAGLAWWGMRHRTERLQRHAA